LNDSNNAFFMNSFSHVYVERDALQYPLAQAILQKVPDAVRIAVDDYKDVFARPRQNFSMQKRAPKIILAVKKPPFLYPGADVCHHFGHTHFYYAPMALNCLYDCEYCFLQGMFLSANIVFFVNIEDFFADTRALLKKHPLSLSISYESDLLAFENIVPYVSQWISFAAEQPDLLVEVRTKSANYAAIRHLRPIPNVILAWTITPAALAREWEPKTPPPAVRLENARQAAADGWKVRLCLDPVLPHENWKEHYRTCIRDMFTVLPAASIHDMSIGVFRIPRDYLKSMRKHRTDSALLHYPFENRNGIMSFPEPVANEWIRFVREEAGAYLPPHKIFELGMES
jgi:spore photoproduct lyase